MIKFEESDFYKLIQDFFVNNNKKTFIQFLGEFYNRTQGIIDKNEMQDDILKELRELYLEFNEKGIDENIVKEKVNYFLENNSKVQAIIAELKNKINYSTNSKVHFIKTMSKGGDCMLIESTKNILIDVGYSTNALNLISYLKTNNINSIDYLILTHYHEDHVGGANAEGFIALCNSDISIKNVVLPHGLINYSLFIESNTYKVGKIISGINSKVVECCNRLSIPVYYPTDEEIIKINKDSYLKFLNLKESNFNRYYNYTVNAYLEEENCTNYNNFSMVVEYHSGENGFLFASDIEELAQELIYTQLNDNIDVLKIEHHSVNYNCYENYFNKIHPKIAAVMPTLPTNEFGLMQNQHFNELVNNGVSIYSSENGTIVVKSDYSGVSVISNSSSVNKLELYNLDQGIALKNGTDLNDCITPGIYNSINSSRTATMINSPIKGAGFKLIVEKTGLYHCLKQTIIINNDQKSLCYTRQSKERVWGDWRRISPYNEIGLAISNIDLNNLKTPGEYYSENTTNTNTITNSPVTGGFRLEVIQLTPWVVLQKLIANSDNIQEFYRYFSSDTWKPWYSYVNTKNLRYEVDKVVYGVGESIAKNSDLNSFTNVGCYTCHDENISATITNKPVDVVSGFKLEVKATNNNIRYQTLFVNDNNIAIYVRYYDVESGFTPWKKLKFEP